MPIDFHVSFFFFDPLVQQFSTLLENQADVTDPTERMRIQSYALRTGGLFRNVGAMLLEFGRTTMTLRMGEAPVCFLFQRGGTTLSVIISQICIFLFSSCVRR